MSMSYTTLTGAKSVAGSIKSWQNYDKVDADGCLEDAQAWVYSRLRVREMRTASNLSVTSGASSVALPTGFLDGLSFRNITDDTDLTLVGEEEIEARRSWTAAVLDTSDPCLVAIFDEALNFECLTNSAFSLRAVFYKSPAILSSENATNFLTARYPHVLRAACLAFAAEQYHNTEDYARNLQRAGGFIQDANAMDELSRRGQFTPVISP